MMKDFYYDLYRINCETGKSKLIKEIIFNKVFRKIYYYRKYQTASFMGRKIIKILNHFLSKNLTIDLPFSCKIGKGLLLLHPYSIAFNSNCIIGDNCTIMKGATVGNSKTGRVGAPTIGNNVYIGLNSTVVGKVQIGNNVMICANTFVNFDVPDGALVLGSPGVIHQKRKASQLYINNSIEKY